VLNVSVISETPVTAMFLNVKRILNVCPSACAHHNRIIRNLLGELAEKNLRFNEKLTHVGQRSTRSKIMSYLSAEAQRLGTYEFDIPFSRQQFADYLGVERSGLSLELGKMKNDGVLDFHKNHFVLRV
jgi:CRP/FNR family transcriptional regulator, cyclic AMP receptor protein